MFGTSLSNLAVARRVRGAFTPPRHRLQAAALPWRQNGQGVEILLVTSRDTGRWILPKGWIEGDEAPCEAAAREAGEEAGVRGHVEAAELGTYFYEKLPTSGEAFRCEVRVFPLEVTSLAEKWKEKGQRRRKWFSRDGAARLVSEPELAVMIAAFRPARLRPD